MSAAKNYQDFDSIRLLTIIDGIIVNETPLRVGIGRESALGATVDNAVYRVNQVPVIPGSSLKGSFRQLAESMMKADGDKLIHDPWDFDAIKKEVEGGKFCTICAIFGNTYLASHVKIFDATPVNPEKVRTFTKTGVAIDREFGGARPGLLYTEEFIAPGNQWNFRMEVINIKIFREADQFDERATILRSILEILMDPGISIGARKSVGCGLIKLKEAKWKVYGLRFGGLSLEDEGEVRKHV
ncbi:MAG: CRISPR-associated RAMP protein Csx7 [Candidatus Nezhaarchaeales archaeon]